MTPAYLKSSPSPFPFVDLNEDQHLEHSSPPQQPKSSLSCPIFFSSTQDQSGSCPKESLQNHNKVEKFDLHGGSSDCRVTSSSSLKPSADETRNAHKIMFSKKENEDESKSSDDRSMKWMSSKMRLMGRMMTSNGSGSDNPAGVGENNCTYNNPADTVRICSDCNTTKTPLWRSGPRGPKSLCNACGIRQRKARRAMAAAAAAAGADVGTDISSTSTKMQNKEKKSRTSYATQKQHVNLLDSSSHTTAGKKPSFEDFALSFRNNSSFRVFPQDEEEAAILLMALSCGLIHS